MMCAYFADDNVYLLPIVLPLGNRKKGETVISAVILDIIIAVWEGSQSFESLLSPTTQSGRVTD
jgi:hypothetical protein